MRLKRVPAVLAVAGSDSGGGAGVQADLKTFAALGVHGLSVITSITAQNPGGVTGVQACSPAIVRKQLAAVSAFEPAAAKTGMLFSAAIITSVGEFFRANRQIRLVVDPVMVATSGAKLLQPAALAALKKLLPLATIMTPNLSEAEALTGQKITEPEDLRTAASALHEMFGCAVLVKGGHLETGDQVIDLLYDGSMELLLEASRARGVATHGTGCTYSAAIAAELALGATLPNAITRAKRFITRAIHTSLTVGPFTVLNTFAGRPKVIPIS